MRKSEFVNKKNEGPNKVLNQDYLPQIKKVWEDCGYDPDYLLTEHNGFYNVLEDYHKSKSELKKMRPDRRGIHPYGEDFIEDYQFMVKEDVQTYRRLYNIARLNFCGFYCVEQHRYFTQDEVARYAEWMLENTWCSRDSYTRGFNENNSYFFELQNKYDAILGKYTAIMCNIAALLIATDMTQYLEEKKLYRAHVKKENVRKFIRHGPYAGQIFDPESMQYRKVEDFAEFAHCIHTQYWFHDPSKGYHKDAPYKWDADVPHLDRL